MRNPETILNSLSAHSKDVHYKYERLYRILFNEQMFYVAYQSIYAKPGNMTPGSDGKTIDGISVDRIGHLIAALKDESYMPTPARRVYIPKKNGKKRPLGIPSIEDKMVQEVVRLFLKPSMRDILRIPRMDSDQEEAVIRLCVPSKLFSLVRTGSSKVTSKDSSTTSTTIF